MAEIDIARLQLGKRPAKVDGKRLRLAKYTLAPPPETSDWTSGILDYGTMLNDRLGDCVFAGLGHALQTLTACIGNPYTVRDSSLLSYYETWAGYNPSDPATDQGYVEVDALNRWRREGFGDPGATFRLLGYADPDPQNLVQVQQSVALFGGVYLGLQLPLSAQAQVGGVWDVVSGSRNNAPGSWGGHAVWSASYSAAELPVITWGKPQGMTWDFLLAYCDEAHALLLEDWAKYASSDFHLGDLEADLQTL